jgi:fibronectin type 3 domain-containing protein
MKKVTVKYCALILLPLLLGACADMFQDKISMGLDDAGSLSDLMFVRAEEIVQLSSPAEVYVADRQHPAEIRVNWSAVDGAASYMVERAVVEPVVESDGTVHYGEPTEDLFEVRESYVTGTSWTDTILGVPAVNSPEYGYRYYYRISAENTLMRLESSPPTEPRLGMLFPPPRKVEASQGVYTNRIMVTWEKVEKAASYIIYRSDSKDGVPFGEVGRTQGNMGSYQNNIPGENRGKEYYYFVAGVSGSGSSSLKSTDAYGYTLVEGAPGVPQGGDLAAGYGRGNHTDRIKIEWIADSTPGAFYAVYRYSSEDSSLTRLTGNTTSTEYEDSSSDLKPGVWYYYKVQTIVNKDGKDLKGPLSDPVEAFLLSPPSGMTALKEGGLVTLKWYPALGSPGEQASYSYKVYTASDKDGPFSHLSTEGSSAGSDGYITKSGLSVPPAFFRVTTVNGGVESAPGEVVSPPPPAALILDATRAENWGAVYTNVDGVYSVRVIWKKPDSETPASYHVYRSTSPAPSSFRRITDVPVPASAESAGQFAYEDKSDAARPGRFYYYRILSLNVLGQGAYYSEIRTGYGALTHDAYFREYVKTVNKSLGKLVNMNKSSSTDKLGDETKYGANGGSIHYDTPDSVLSAIPPFDILITYTNYADFYINNDSALGWYFILNGQSNTHVTDMSGAGSMFGTVTATGMYPGTVSYGTQSGPNASNSIIITGQNPAGGVYTVTPTGFGSATVSWILGKR